ncbi:hypothetical protein D3C87_1440210 [compost metagenome]
MATPKIYCENQATNGVIQNHCQRAACHAQPPKACRAKDQQPRYRYQDDAAAAHHPHRQAHIATAPDDRQQGIEQPNQRCPAKDDGGIVVCVPKRCAASAHGTERRGAESQDEPCRDKPKRHRNRDSMPNQCVGLHAVVAPQRPRNRAKHSPTNRTGRKRRRQRQQWKHNRHTSEHVFTKLGEKPHLHQSDKGLAKHHQQCRAGKRQHHRQNWGGQQALGLDVTAAGIGLRGHDGTRRRFWASAE